MCSEVGNQGSKIVSQLVVGQQGRQQTLPFLRLPEDLGGGLDGLARIGQDELKIIGIPAHGGHGRVCFFDDSIQFLARGRQGGRHLVQMIEGTLEILQVRLRKSLLIKTGHGGVKILHGRAQIVHQRAPFPRQIVHAGFARAIDHRILRHRGSRLARRHHDIDKAIA